jgi:D-inositol-3-phosphate glycosyltransferase
MKGRRVPVDLTGKKLVIVADSPTATTGFGRVTLNIVKRVPYDTYIMGINYFGDWSPEVAQYKIWPANNGNDDIYGYGKLYNFLMGVKPEILFIINDPWVAVNYKKAILKYKEQFPLRAVLYTPVDTDYIPAQYVEPLNECFDHIVTYTQFGVDVLKEHVTVPLSWITHGVDQTIFKPETKELIRNKLRIPPDSYVVLTTAANNPRKRLDMTVQTFAAWVNRYNLPEYVRWYYHGSISGYGWNILDLCEQYGVKNRLILTDPTMGMLTSITDEQMNLVYNTADVFYTTTQSEGGI